MSADSWAQKAAALPLAFSQVREDPRLDLEIAEKLPPGASAMMIASGGETALCLARLPLSRLLLVDLNPAQLALSRCRFHLAENFSPTENLRLLGHAEMPAETRGKSWLAIFSELDLAPDIFGEPLTVASRGPDHCGRYEVAFAELRHALRPHTQAITDFLKMTDAVNASRAIAVGTSFGKALDGAFAQVFALENLVALFGEGATHNPRRPFHEHFPAQLRAITARQAPAENPWIWQILTGKFPPSAAYDWLHDASPIRTRPKYFRATMLDALNAASEQSVDFLHLSNILDWLSQNDARETLAAAHRVLRPGGILMIRQLNSSLDIPALFPKLKWDEATGRRLQLADRSFFYPHILLATRL